jgi:hypothetical protein
MFVYRYPNNQLHCGLVPLGPHELADLEFVIETDEPIKCNTHRYEQGKIVPIPMPLSLVRQYGAVGEQLDRLWHDIDQGLFGPSAKTGEFYQKILEVKTAFPKLG